MTEEVTQPRKILVALDASSYGMAALEAAAKLAADARAELEGLFVEDINLLRLAGLPFAQEITPSSIARQLDLGAMERALQSHADQIRQAIERTCHRVSIQWSFRVSRGRVTRNTLESSADVDLLIMGRQGASVAHSHLARDKRPILVVFDGSLASKRAVGVAAQFSRSDARPIAVVLANSHDQTAAELQQAFEELCRAQSLSASIDSRLATNASAIRATAERWSAELLLLNRDSELLDEGAIEELVSQLECPVGLVR